jgi:hypothetical protein
MSKITFVSTRLAFLPSDQFHPNLLAGSREHQSHSKCATMQQHFQLRCMHRGSNSAEAGCELEILLTCHTNISFSFGNGMGRKPLFLKKDFANMLHVPWCACYRVLPGQCKFFCSSIWNAVAKFRRYKSGQPSWAIISWQKSLFAYSGRPNCGLRRARIPWKLFTSSALSSRTESVEPLKLSGQFRDSEKQIHRYT